MAIKEQKRQKRKQKEWVKARIGCTIQGVFSNLKCTLHYDVNTFNDSDPKHKFEVVDINGIDGVIIRKIGARRAVGNDYVTVKIKDSKIQVSQNEEPVFTVTPKWDQTALECKLLIDDDNNTPLSCPQISQRAIGEMLFQPPVYPVSR